MVGMENFFTILGGMGTLATESFIHVLNERTPTTSDQDYLNYVLVNHATVPDRTAYLLGNSDKNPVIPLKEDIRQHSQLKPDFFVLTCNTAHNFYEELAGVTDIPMLHMPRLAVEAVHKKFAEGKSSIRVALLATEGTIKSKVYEKELAKHSKIKTVIPGKKVQEKITNLIYRDIKERDFLNTALYNEILQEMIEVEKCDVALLGCTELSLMQEATKNDHFPVVDAQSELVDETIRLALAGRK